jgi:hypothetical protein
MRRDWVSRLALLCASGGTGVFGLFPAVAQAASFSVGESLPNGPAEIVVTGVQDCSGGGAERMSGTVEELDWGTGADRLNAFGAAGPSCSVKNRIESDFELATVLLTDAAAFTACTAVGAPVAVSFAAGAAVSATAQFMVKRVPCQDSDKPQDIDAKVKAAVCDALARKGIGGCR